MSDPTPTRPSAVRAPERTSASPASTFTPIQTPTASPADQMVCDRCGAGMYRMHAVWRCAACGFKTDCCGW